MGKLSPGGYNKNHPERCYLRRWIPGRGLVYEHRFIMEAHIGRALSDSEQVHHVNGDTLDNRIENLELHADQASHLRRHRKSDGNEIVALYDQGLSAMAVARKLGISDRTVLRVVREAGSQRTLSQAAGLRSRRADGTFARP